MSLWTGITNVSCNNNNDGIIDVNVIGGTTPYTFILDSNIIQNNSSFINLAQGNYIIEVIDSSGCKKSITATINTTGSNNYDSHHLACDSFFVGGSYEYISGTNTITYIATNGCDSIVNLNLTINILSTNEINNYNKKLLKITDLLGKKISNRRNILQLYI